MKQSDRYALLSNLPPPPAARRPTATRPNGERSIRNIEPNKRRIQHTHRCTFFSSEFPTRGTRRAEVTVPVAGHCCTDDQVHSSRHRPKAKSTVKLLNLHSVFPRRDTMSHVLALMP